MLWRDGVHEENIEPPQCKPRRTQGDTRHTRKGSSVHRPLRKALCAGGRALPARAAPPARGSRVTPRRARRPRRNPKKRNAAATTPQECARATVGTGYDKASDSVPVRPGRAGNPLADARSAPKAPLVRQTPTLQTA
jgi:hypothetical protein